MGGDAFAVARRGICLLHEVVRGHAFLREGLNDRDRTLIGERGVMRGTAVCVADHDHFGRRFIFDVGGNLADDPLAILGLVRIVGIEIDKIILRLIESRASAQRRKHDEAEENAKMRGMLFTCFRDSRWPLRVVRLR